MNARLEDEHQLQMALAMSKEDVEVEEKRRNDDELKMRMAFAMSKEKLGVKDERRENEELKLNFASVVNELHDKQKQRTNVELRLQMRNGEKQKDDDRVKS